MRQLVLRHAVMAGAALALIGPMLGLAARPAFANGPTVTGTGSSFAAPAILQWEADERAYGVNVNYQQSASVTGLQEFAQNQVDFGASEIGYSTGQSPQTPTAPYQYLPDVSGGIAMAYNLTGTDGQRITDLHLDPSALLGIFTAQITNWSDPQIASINPGVPLPNEPIRVVYRTDPAGESYILSYYFSYLFPAQWNAYAEAMTHQSGPQAYWPIPQTGSVPGYNFRYWIGQQGSDAAAGYVSEGSNEGSITYVEEAWAILDNLPAASLANASGNYTQPTFGNVAIALTKAYLYPDLEEDLRPVFTNPDPNTYPLSSYSYFITLEGSEAPDKGAVLGKFIEYAACEGQARVLALQYAPVPPNLVAEDFAGVGRLNGAAPPPPINAQTCPNPYITGQLKYPGGGSGPQIGGSAGPATGGPDASGLTPAAAAAAANAGKCTSSSHSGCGRGGSDSALARVAALLGALKSSFLSHAPIAVMIAAALGLIALIALPPLGGEYVRRRRALRAAAVRSEPPLQSGPPGEAS